MKRAQKTWDQKSQEGTLLSFTVVHHPPKGFPAGKRTIGLIELADGNKVCAPLITQSEPKIGCTVAPTMRLSKVNEQGLRQYDVHYRVLETRKVSEEFPGYIIALTGPSGVGKTTVSILLSTSVTSYVERVPILTTRDPKKEDSDEYIHVSPEEFTKLEKEHALASFVSIPSRSEKRWYGYRKSDIEAIWKKGKVPVVITEMHLLQGLADAYGRRSILSFGLLPPGTSKRQMLSALLHRLRERGRDTEKQIEDRLKNAEADLEFFDERKELFDHMIVNDKLETVVEVVTNRMMELEN